jgi:hypothetical protein
MLVLGYRGGFKNLDIQTVTSLYIYALKMFDFRNSPTSGQLSTPLTPQYISQTQDIRTNCINHQFSSIQKGVTYTFFNVLNKITTKNIETSYRFSYYKVWVKKIACKEDFIINR